jgi:type IV secretion system protein VirB8
VEISILSTSFIKPHVALVRYIKKVERGNDAPEITHWAATVVFRYSSAPMKARDREINPLGFQCIEYRNDPDSMAVVMAPPPNHQAQAQTQPQGPVLFEDPRPNDAAPAASHATNYRGGK